jgi:hypothetical protein
MKGNRTMTDAARQEVERQQAVLVAAGHSAGRDAPGQA